MSKNPYPVLFEPAMSASTSYHQLGLFLVLFQHVEGTVNEVIGHLVPAQDPHAVRILISALGYNQRLKVTEALLRRTLEMNPRAETTLTSDAFSALMKKLETRRKEKLADALQVLRVDY